MNENYRIGKDEFPPRKPPPDRPKVDNSEPDDIAASIFQLKNGEFLYKDVPFGAQDRVASHNQSGVYERSRAVTRFIKQVQDAGNRHDPPFKIHSRINEDNRQIIRNPDNTITVQFRRGKLRSQLAEEAAKKVL